MFPSQSLSPVSSLRERLRGGACSEGNSLTSDLLVFGEQSLMELILPQESQEVLGTGLLLEVV